MLNQRRALMELRRKNMGVGSRTTGLWSLLAAILTAGILAGCVTQSVTQTQEPFIAGKYRAVRVEPREDRTGFREIET
jgi:hypothetical protein